MLRKIALVLVVLVLLLTVGLIIGSSSLMTYDLFGNAKMPMGTLISWLAIIFVPVLIFLAIPAFNHPASKIIKVYKTILVAHICLALLWGFIGFYLAGNWAFTFSGNVEKFRGSAVAAGWFWGITIFDVVLPLIFIFVFFIHLLILKLFFKHRI